MHNDLLFRVLHLYQCLAANEGPCCDYIPNPRISSITKHVASKEKPPGLYSLSLNDIKPAHHKLLALQANAQPQFKLTLRVQVLNNHILTQNQYHNYYHPKPKYLAIAYMDPLGYIQKLKSLKNRNRQARILEDQNAEAAQLPVSAYRTVRIRVCIRA